MALEKDIYNAMKAALVAAQASTLSYVKANSLQDGRFLTEPSGAFPVVALDLDTAAEEAHTAPDRFKMTYRYQIYCAVEDIDWGRSILGDVTYKGILDLANDVKNVLSADLRLGLSASGVVRIRFPDTKYFVENFPIREALISVEVEATIAKQGR